MKKRIVICFIVMLVAGGCDEWPFKDGSRAPAYLNKYPGDLAVKWMELQMRITRSTAGFGPGPATRAFAYSGLILYESIQKGMPGYKSVASKLMGQDLNSNNTSSDIFWPASANAAMAVALKSFIPSASEISTTRVDSLEAAFNAEFSQNIPSNILASSADYGRGIAQSIFEWSKSDGVAAAMASNSSYIVPVGEGLWEKTPPAFAAPINVYIGDTRTFAPNAVTLTAPPPPNPYSTDAFMSPFFAMAYDVYTISTTLTDYDVQTVKTWGDEPGNYSNGLRFQQIAIQLIGDEHLFLPDAAVAFAKHGMALQDAIVAVFKAKYIYNVVRPITYIRNVMGYTTWNTVIPTPPHPEYPAAHATVGRASSRVLESVFGKHFSFTDRSHEKTFGARHYATLESYSIEAGKSRVLGGIHYMPSIQAGWTQGEQIGDLINKLPFK